MKRSIMVLTVGAIVAVMMALSAAPALANVEFDNGDIDFDRGDGFTSFISSRNFGDFDDDDFDFDFDDDGFDFDDDDFDFDFDFDDDVDVDVDGSDVDVDVD